MQWHQCSSYEYFIRDHDELKPTALVYKMNGWFSSLDQDPIN